MESDFISIESPIYGQDLPIIVLKFIEKLKVTKSISGKKIFFIRSVGFLDGFGPFTFKKALKGTGLDLVGYISIKMSSNFSTPLIKMNPARREVLESRMSKGLADVQKLIMSILSGKKHIKNIGPYLLPCIIIRNATRKLKRKMYLAWDVNTDTCIKCMVCRDNCPTRSIIYQNEKFEFLASCTACGRCYNFCPTCSILHKGKYADPETYKRYRGPAEYLKRKQEGKK